MIHLKLNKYKNTLFYIYLCLLSACYEPKEGCLDVRATNFNVDADRNCCDRDNQPCCCEYPKLNLKVEHKFGTETWQEDSAYTNSLGQRFRINRATFYLSEFALTQNGQRQGIVDSLQLSVLPLSGNDTTNRFFINDFQLVRRVPIDYTPGTFRGEGAFQEVQFRVGLPAAAQQVTPNRAPSGHPLRLQNERLWGGRTTGYAAMQLIVTRNLAPTTQPDTLTFFRPEFDNLAVRLPVTFVQPRGFSSTLILTINYAQLFNGVDLSNLSTDALKKALWANLPRSFNVRQ